MIGMSTRKQSYKFTPPPETAARACASAGCTGAGEYRAPKSREQLHEYQWFCLDHVKEYNQKWNYFSDMDADEIEYFMKDAVTGHRPTWERESQMRARYADYTKKLHEEWQRFFHGREQPQQQAPSPGIYSKERKALAVLDITEPCGADALKAHYRKLVKQYHPDLHQGDKVREDKFKEITAAYTYLVELYKLR